MAAYKEIVTKAVIGKGKKYFKNNYTVQIEGTPTTVLGCWVINHKFKGYKSGEKIGVSGSYDVNIWYSYDNDTKTTVATKTITYSAEESLTLLWVESIIYCEEKRFFLHSPAKGWENTSRLVMIIHGQSMVCPVLFLRSFFMAFQIITDTCCDFPNEMYSELALSVAPLTLNFRGSSNQRVIDMNAYRKTGKIKTLF